MARFRLAWQRARLAFSSNAPAECWGFCLSGSVRVKRCGEGQTMMIVIEIVGRGEWSGHNSHCFKRGGESCHAWAPGPGPGPDERERI